MPDKAVIFTGHRPDVFGVDSPNLWMPFVEYMAELLVAEAIKLESEDILHVVQGLAKGSDLAAGAAALVAKKRVHNVKLVSIKPFEGDVSAFKHPGWELWHTSVWQRSDDRRVAAAHKWDYKSRNQDLVLYPEREAIPGELWPVWDGKQGRGTSQTVNMAHRAGLMVRTDLELFKHARRLLQAG